MTVLEAIKSVNYKNVFERALWTFVEGFLAVIIIGFDSIIDLLFQANWHGLMVTGLALLAGGLAAGLSALKTILHEVIKQVKQNAGV